MKHAVARFFCGQCEMQYIVTVCREKSNSSRMMSFVNGIFPKGIFWVWDFTAYQPKSLEKKLNLLNFEDIFLQRYFRTNV